MPTSLNLRKTLITALSVLAASSFLVAAPAQAAHSVPETYQALVTQINAGQVRSATLTPKKNNVKVRLANKQRFVATYPAGGQAQLTSLLTAHGAKVHVRRSHTAKASSHIRYRYIALAIIVLGGLAALGYYFLRGRPTAPPAGAGDAPAAEAPAAGAAGAETAGAAAPVDAGPAKGRPPPPPGGAAAP